jgi:hypothetical protein
MIRGDGTSRFVHEVLAVGVWGLCVLISRNSYGICMVIRFNGMGVLLVATVGRPNNRFSIMIHTSSIFSFLALMPSIITKPTHSYHHYSGRTAHQSA